MKKLIYLLWDATEMTPEQRRIRLLNEAAPQILELKPAGLQINICDDFATTPSPAPTPLFSEPFTAQLNLWLDDEQDIDTATQDILRKAGFQLNAYSAEEWLYTDYGEHHHPDAAAARDWPDGERSPGILAVTLLRKPARLSKDEWMRRWFGRQSPMSEKMQPRARYVRHVIDQALTPGAEHIDGLVEEDWPSSEHVTDLKRFYGANNWLGVAKNMSIMLHSVTRILNLFNITTVMMSEYFVLTPPGHCPAPQATDM